MEVSKSVEAPESKRPRVDGESFTGVPGCWGYGLNLSVVKIKSLELYLDYATLHEKCGATLDGGWEKARGRRLLVMEGPQESGKRGKTQAPKHGNPGMDCVECDL